MRKRWINGTRSSHLWRSRHKPVQEGRVALLYRREMKRFINVRRFFIDSQAQSPPCPGMKPSPALLQSPRSAHCSPCPLGKHRALAPCAGTLRGTRVQSHLGHAAAQDFSACMVWGCADGTEGRFLSVLDASGWDNWGGNPQISAVLGGIRAWLGNRAF